MSQASLLNALSSFWHRCFADLPKLDAVYTGAEMYVADAYVQMLSDIAAQDVRFAPLKYRKQPQLVTLNEREARVESEGVLSFPLAQPYTSIQFLQTSPLGAEVNLSQRAGQFQISVGRLRLPQATLTDARIPRQVTYVAAGAVVTLPPEVPFVPQGTLLSLTYVGGRQQTLVALGESLFDPDARIVGTVAGVSPVKVGVASLSLGGTTYSVTVSPGTAVPYTSWALWAVDGDVDTRQLYRSFGHMLGSERPSSEQYRAFVRGVMQLQLLGPAVRRLEAGLSVVAGLPVTQTDGEVVLEVSSGRVVTTAGTYTFPTSIPAAVTVGEALAAFYPLARGVAILDEVSSPGWWHGELIPESLLPDVPDNARLADVTPYPTEIGPSARWFVGDFSMRVGAPFALTTAFVLTDEIFSKNMFSVDVHPTVQQDATVFRDLTRLVQENRPSHTYVFIRPITRFRDVARITDTLTIKQYIYLTDSLGVQDNWAVGDDPPAVGYAFTIDAAGTYTEDSEGFPVVVGGGRPETPGPGNIGDGAVQITAAAVDPEGYTSPLYAFAQPTGATLTGGSGTTDQPD